MAKRAVSLNIVVDLNDIDVLGGRTLKIKVMQRMIDILAGSYDSFSDNVTIELFDDNVDEDEEELDLSLNPDYLEHSQEAKFLNS